MLCTSLLDRWREGPFPGRSCNIDKASQTNALKGNVLLDNISQEQLSAGGYDLDKRNKAAPSLPPEGGGHPQHTDSCLHRDVCLSPLLKQLSLQSSSFPHLAKCLLHIDKGPCSRPLWRHGNPLPLPEIHITLLKSSEVALISFHVLFRSWIQMQKNSSKDLSWVKNIGWKSLQVSLAGGNMENKGRSFRTVKREDITTGRCPRGRQAEVSLVQAIMVKKHF